MHLTWLLLSAVLAVTLALQSPQCPSTLRNVLSTALVPPNFCASRWASQLLSPRGMTISLNNDVLVIESGTSSIVALWDENNDGVSNSTERVVLATQAGLNHGIVVGPDGYLYASSPTTVFRWLYSPGTRKSLGASQVVVSGMPGGGHSSRTLQFGPDGELYVTIGSASNIDQTDVRSRMYKYNLHSLPSNGIPWQSGVLVARGLRNEVGIRFDRFGNLWGVENGCDNLRRNDLGGDIHQNNPAEELNLFNEPGAFYGYPNCWSVYNLAGYQRKDQLAHPDFMPGTTDAWCNLTSNVVKPAYAFGAHMAPLDITFWQSSSTSSFPSDYVDDAFVSFHGSWNRQPAAGYKVSRVRYDSTTHMPVSDEDFLKLNSNNAYQNGWLRPVGLAQFGCPFGQCLLVSSDTTGDITLISYHGSDGRRRASIL